MRTTLFVLALVGSVAFAACSSDNTTTCNCSVEVGAEKRELTCGESACVGGFQFSCAENTATKGAACTAGTSSSSSSSSSTSSSSTSSSSTSSSGGSGDSSCTDLATYCSTKCKTPESVNQNCTETASKGNGSKCVAWKATNGGLCKP